MRPTTKAGRLSSGYQRIGTSNRAASRSGSSIEQALQNNRGATRAITSNGRYVRLGTASLMQSTNGNFINADKLDMKKMASKKHISKSLFNYLFSC